MPSQFSALARQKAVEIVSTRFHNPAIINFVSTKFFMGTGQRQIEIYEFGPSEEQGKVTEAELNHKDKAHQPTVEDGGTTSIEVTTTNNQNEVEQASLNQPKLWISQRSVGEFHRSLSFPSRVDQDGVKTSLKNGILEIVEPKAAKPASKKISIN
ncbi:hypothetical protein EJ08DRAFT_666828 [Tothia fuscella]|uniref:SHSP domain-containing protein n=1 Tax=Tothia fuscella TaxID=1048955 RepID=A0A9P4NE11_9PEZI|nr:hypothetical protein EJ08DRAFT_666828 [Tothia fuscella]